MDLENKIRFVMDTLVPMAEATFPFLVRIAGFHNPLVAEPIGTGFLAMCDQSRLLVTAAHVLEKEAEYAGLVISRGLGESPFTIPKDIQPVIDAEADLAILVLPEDYRPGPDRRFLNLDRSHVDDSPDRRYRDYLFAHGFPGARARFVPFEGFGLVSKSLPFGAMQRDPPPPTLGSHRFAMHYEGTGGETTDVTGDVWVLPEGLSGSPVFRIGGIDSPIADWTPERSRLVGVVTDWDQEAQAIIASDVSRLLALAQCPIATH